MRLRFFWGVVRLDGNPGGDVLLKNLDMCFFFRLFVLGFLGVEF